MWLKDGFIMSKLLGVLICGCVCLVLGLGSTGCTKKNEKEKSVEKKTTTTTPGGGTETKTESTEKKTSTTDSKVGTTDATKKFMLKAPIDVTITQGETAKVHIDITRNQYTDPVDLKFADLPPGVTAEEKTTTINKDAPTTEVTLKAAPDAKPVENHTVRVTGTGGATTHDASFKLTVKEKKKG